MKTLVLSIAVLLSLAVSGCGIILCSPGHMQCDGNTVQICSAGGIWEDFQRCGAPSLGPHCFEGPAGCFGFVNAACCN